MIPFFKIRLREIRMQSYTAFRKSVHTAFRESSMGLFGAEFIANICRIDFDVQLQEHQAREVVSRFRRSVRPFIIISAN